MRVIILAGAGKHFSAGHDLGSPQEMEDQKKTPLEPGFKGEYRRLWERFFENTMRWRDLPKPTIAQVQGYCIMGGMMIASACDLIIASEDAQFADRAVKWGGSHVQYFSMPWDFGPRKTKEYLFTGRLHQRRRGRGAPGLVNRVVPREKLEAETMALAQDIAERDPYALKLAKASVNETQGRAGLASRRWRTPSRTTCSPSRIASRWEPTALPPREVPKDHASAFSTRRWFERSCPSPRWGESWCCEGLPCGRRFLPNFTYQEKELEYVSAFGVTTGGRAGSGGTVRHLEGDVVTKRIVSSGPVP